jgi:hypothetical protein
MKGGRVRYERRKNETGRYVQIESIYRTTVMQQNCYSSNGQGSSKKEHVQNNSCAVQQQLSQGVAAAVHAFSYLGYIALKVLHLHNAIEQNTRSSNASQCGSYLV